MRPSRAFAARVFPPRVTEEEKTLKRTASTESLGRWEAIAAGTLTLDANQPGDLLQRKQTAAPAWHQPALWSLLRRNAL